ncbi:sensor histidine kinase [Leucobacter sp. OH1287]|uniref:sensor histidine kinase n=1 Tax=Leucobacter sp. OH1287 TaxID=2491049 RepID=UPI001F35488F|nr:histidine kinase N-terminal domain-containing protein [Leucobacter sp. OH1287]
MSTLREISNKYTDLNEAEVEWLEYLTLDWPLLADLALSDVVLWVPSGDQYLALAHSRPTGLITMFYRDVIGDFLRDDWREVVEMALKTNQPAASTSLTWHEETPMQMTAYPVSRIDPDTGKKIGPFAVITLHTSPNDTYNTSRMGVAYRDSADDLLVMIQNGDFPDTTVQKGRMRGAPRAGDGLIRVNKDGIITFASPNTLTSFARLGYRDELEDESLPEIVAEITKGIYDTNESLPSIMAGKIPGRGDIESRGRTIAARSIPVVIGGERVGGIIVTRDITDIRQHAQELITKNATIREIHHRVKNNLQTVASLLRVQARRAKSDEAKQVLGQAMRRVAAIAVVHDTLAAGVSQIVQFDDVFDRVVGLAAEVASLHNTVAQLRKEGEFGKLQSEHATPLALALTEVVTNAVEHGFADREGTVTIKAERDEHELRVRVSDDGSGLPDGKISEGLGTSIVRTLIEGELAGTINWSNGENGGTQVDIVIPIRWEIKED